MSTHIVPCIVCNKEVGCCQDEHALGLGGKHGEAGCENPPHIEFCSIEHFLELKCRIDKSFTERIEKVDGKYRIKLAFTDPEADLLKESDK